MKRFLVLIIMMCIAGSVWSDYFNDFSGTEADPDYTVYGYQDVKWGLNSATYGTYARIQQGWWANPRTTTFSLTSQQIELGDTVTTEFMYGGKNWTGNAILSVGLISATDDRTTNLAVAMLAMNTSNTARLIYYYDGTSIQTINANFAWDDAASSTMTFDMIVGDDKGDGSFDVTFNYYDTWAKSTLIGTNTVTAKTPTGNIYWSAGDYAANTDIYTLSIIPEPATIALVCVGSLTMIRYRRKFQ